MEVCLLLLLLVLVGMGGYALGQINAGISMAERKLEQLQEEVDAIK